MIFLQLVMHFTRFLLIEYSENQFLSHWHVGSTCQFILLNIFPFLLNTERLTCGVYMSVAIFKIIKRHGRWHVGSTCQCYILKIFAQINGAEADRWDRRVSAQYLELNRAEPTLERATRWLGRSGLATGPGEGSWVRKPTHPFSIQTT